MVINHRKKHAPDLTHFIGFIKQNTVMCVAFFAALITSLIVTPDEKYLSYIDYKTVTCLFITLAVICALRNIRFFTVVARKLVSLSGTARKTVILLLIITFVGSMLIANESARRC